MKVKPARIRIIGGQWRRRLLPVLDSEGLRPTPDRVRETLFNWLNAELPEAHCLDLFAGTGVLAFEALSRGAKEAVLIEKNSKVAAQLRQSAEVLSAHHARILQMDVLEYLKQAPAQPFDVIFCEPPYASNLWQHCLDALIHSGWLSEDGILYLEHPRNDPPPDFSQWQIYKQNHAGNIEFYLLKKGSDHV